MWISYKVQFQQTYKIWLTVTTQCTALLQNITNPNINMYEGSGPLKKKIQWGYEQTREFVNQSVWAATQKSEPIPQSSDFF